MPTVSRMTYADDEDRLLPIGEAARQLGVSIDTIRRWEHDEKLHGTRTPGGQRRFRQSEIDRLLATGPEHAEHVA
jgi:excisionase family DNA binding protein